VSDADYERLLEKLEHEADALARRSQELQGEVDDTRADWERKRADQSVPGAVAPDAQTGGSDED
jgi:hypothetical protein